MFLPIEWLLTLENEAKQITEHWKKLWSEHRNQLLGDERAACGGLGSVRGWKNGLGVVIG